MVVGLAAFAGSLSGQEIGKGSTLSIEVLSAGHFLVEQGSWRAEWFLAGVWAPEPPSGRGAGEYRGTDARDAVRRLLREHRVRVVARWQSQGRTMIRASVYRDQDQPLEPVFDLRQPSDDLAEWLTLNGLGVCDRPTAQTRIHGEAVCQAEREARRERRGMHDGGHSTHQSDLWRTVDVGRLADSETSDDIPPELVFFLLTLESMIQEANATSLSANPNLRPLEEDWFYPVKN